MMTIGKRLGLTGAQRIILDEIQSRRASSQDVSVRILADATHYSKRTVVRTINELRELGVLEIEQPCNGSAADYVLQEEAMRFNLGTLRDLAIALRNAARMSPAERTERLEQAKLARDIYYQALSLQVMALDMEDPAANEALAYIERTEAVDVDKIWPVDEGIKILVELQNYKAHLEELLKEIGDDDDVEV